MSTATPSLDLLRAAPHVRLGPHRRHIDRTLLVGLAPVVVVALMRHGRAALVLFAAAAAGGLLGDALGRLLRRPRRRWRPAHAVTMGGLVAMMVSASTSPLAVGLAALASVLLARVLRDRFETYVWHPAIVGWMLVLLIAPRVGHAHEAVVPAVRPIDLLLQAYVAPPDGGVQRLRDLALHELPPWEATLRGDVAGGLGETCGIALLGAGLWLIYVRNLRWQAPVCALVAAGVVAALWPVRGPAGEWLNLPLALRIDDFPIGVTLVLYHLTGGGLLLAAVFFAADTISTPLNARGHALFGVALGAGTVALRASGLAFGACWWTLLALNTLVPLIDRVTRRRVWGT